MPGIIVSGANQTGLVKSIDLISNRNDDDSGIFSAANETGKKNCLNCDSSSA